jgi:hypothetical protein
MIIVNVAGLGTPAKHSFPHGEIRRTTNSREAGDEDSSHLSLTCQRGLIQGC